MKVAKASKKDIESTLHFLLSAEMALDRDKFSFGCAEDNWEDLDDEDEDKILILKIKKSLIENEGSHIDNRVLMFEFLRKKFAKCNTSWRRVHLAADCLIKFACDPTEDHLAFYPGFELFHVAPEQ